MSDAAAAPPANGQRQGSIVLATLSGRLLGPARLRLAFLVLIAAIPLLLLSATLALQNYRLAVATTSQTAFRLREAAVARYQSAISGSEQLLQALAQMPELTSGDPAICHARLASLLALQPDRYANIAASDAAGRVRCAARTLPGALANHVPGLGPLLAVAAARHGFAVGPVRPSMVTKHTVIPAAYPIMQEGRIAGFLYASLRIDWFARANSLAPATPSTIWITDKTGHITRVSEAASPSLPASKLLAHLQATAVLGDERSLAGVPTTYASARLDDGYGLIVAVPAAADREAATGLLVRRIGQLGLLLLMGLAAVAIGTHLALVEPLGQLSQAIARWRLTGRFDASALRAPPTEVREMAETFAEATAAIADHAARHQVAVAQQELLMREIHHRVKNNLQIVASLLNLQASRIRLPEARAEFASARDRVRALATLHRHLYLQGEVHTIDMPSFLAELCNQLFRAMGEEPGRRIALAIEASPLQMSSDQAVPLSLIVTEAVSNAVKYAFPAGRTGHVSVKLTSDGETADLNITDDGVGIPSGKTETETGTRDGIGISLIRGFARQLGATLTVHEGSGTAYAVHIPLNHEAEPEAAA